LRDPDAGSRHFGRGRERGLDASLDGAMSRLRLPQLLPGDTHGLALMQRLDEAARDFGRGVELGGGVPGG
jgi:hypothetical protein